MFEIQEFNPTFESHLYEDEDRFIIVDEEGYDEFGEHYSLEEAQAIVDEINKQE